METSSLPSQLFSMLLRRKDNYPTENYTTPNGLVCRMPLHLVPSDTPMTGSFTFHTITMIITGACACISLLSIIFLLFRHATHLSRPNEQLHIMRIAIYLPILAVGLFLEAAFPAAFVYIGPWLEFIQSLALCSFFLLLCQMVSTSDHHREHFFATLQIPVGKRKQRRMQRQQRRRAGGGRRSRRAFESAEQGGEEQPKAMESGLGAYRRMFRFIFLYPIIQFLVAILVCATEAAHAYCLVSSKPKAAHLWLDLLHNFGITVAVGSILGMYKILAKRLKHQRPLAKLLAFKLLVAVTFFIQLIYWILRDIDSNPLKPTAHLSWSDINNTVPALIQSLLTVPFAFFFHWAYTVSPYKLENAGRHGPLINKHEDIESAAAVPTGDGTAANKLAHQRGQQHQVSEVGGAYQGGFLGFRAFLGVLNPGEIIQGMRFALFTSAEEKNAMFGMEA